MNELYFEKEIKMTIGELEKVEMVIASVRAEKDVLEIKLKRNNLGVTDYKRLGIISKQFRKLEADIKRLNRNLTELESLRSQKIKQGNIQKTNNEDRIFRNIAYESLPPEVFNAIEGEVAKRVQM